MRDISKRIGAFFSKERKQSTAELQQTDPVADEPLAAQKVQAGVAQPASPSAQPVSRASAAPQSGSGPLPTVSYSFNFKTLPIAGVAPSAPVAAPPKDPLVEAVDLHKQGRLAEAEARYLKLLETQPGNADVYQYIGMLHLQRGEVDQGVARIKEALALDPNHFAALSNLGNALLEQQDFEGACSQFEKASQLRPDNPVIWYGLSRARLGLALMGEAAESLNQALALKSDFPEALLMLAKVHYSLKEYVQASEVAKRALAFFPEDPHLNYFCGIAAKDRGDAAAAQAYLDRALQADPALADAWYLKGDVDQKLGQTEKALAAFQRCLELMPEHLDAAMSSATLRIGLGRYPEALRLLDHVLERDPQHVLAMAEKGQLLVACARNEEARALLKQANEKLGNLLSMEFRHVIAGIPRLRYEDDRLDELRTRLTQEMSVLATRIQSEQEEDAVSVVGEAQPFYLAYQELNNRDLLTQYGSLCCELMAQWAAGQSDPAPLNLLPKTAGKRRIGIFSAHVHEHSVWRAIVRGWVCELNRDQFELFIFCPDAKVDQQTKLAKDSVEQFLQGEKTLPEWIRCIREANLDVLIHPELGMDSLTAKLASLRLAPVQMGSWGHPETTGLSTIDYYLSADLFEAPQAQDYYSEKLVRLPNLGCCFESLEAKPETLDLESFAIDADATVFVCPGTPFKYMPEYDEVFVKIARQVPNAKFVFFNFGPLAPLPELLMQRLGQTLQQAGLNPDHHLRLIPWQSRPGFYGLLKKTHVFLDTIGFSGFNTVMHAVDCETPIVTIEGGFMRGRFGSAILRRIGLSEYVCQNVDEYVDLAVRMVKDASLRERMSKQMVAGRDLLYGDKEPIRALETVLLEVTGGEAA